MRSSRNINNILVETISYHDRGQNSLEESQMMRSRSRLYRAFEVGTNGRNSRLEESGHLQAQIAAEEDNLDYT